MNAIAHLGGNELQTANAKGNSANGESASSGSFLDTLMSVTEDAQQSATPIPVSEMATKNSTDEKEAASNGNRKDASNDNEEDTRSDDAQLCNQLNPYICAPVQLQAECVDAPVVDKGNANSAQGAEGGLLPTYNAQATVEAGGAVDADYDFVKDEATADLQQAALRAGTSNALSASANHVQDQNELNKILSDLKVKVAQEAAASADNDNSAPAQVAEVTMAESCLQQDKGNATPLVESVAAGLQGMQMVSTQDSMAQSIGFVRELTAMSEEFKQSKLDKNTMPTGDGSNADVTKTEVSAEGNNALASISPAGQLGQDRSVGSNSQSNAVISSAKAAEQTTGDGARPMVTGGQDRARRQGNSSGSASLENTVPAFATLVPLQNQTTDKSSVQVAQPALSANNTEVVKDTNAVQNQVQTARLIQTASQTQMHVGMSSSEFGSISINTSSTHNTVSAQISVDHAELAKTLNATLHDFHSRTSSQPMDVKVEMHGAGMNFNQGSNEQNGGSQGSGKQSFSDSRQSDSGVNSYSTLAAVEQRPVSLISTPASIGMRNDGRLDITA